MVTREAEKMCMTPIQWYLVYSSYSLASAESQDGAGHKMISKS